MPLILFGWPDMAREETRFALEIPRLGSLILTHSWDGQFPGLKEFPEDRPNSTIVFWSFRVMVGLGMLMLLLGAWACGCAARVRCFESRAFLRFALLMGPAGLVAIIAGWFTTEIGRQPWVVYGLQRTADAASPHGAMPLAIAGALHRHLLRGLRRGHRLHAATGAQGPGAHEGGPEHGGEAAPGHPMRPLSAATAEDSGLAPRRS